MSKFGQVRLAHLRISTSIAAILVGLGALAQEATPVPPVSVTAPQAANQPNDGSAAAGYRVDSATAAGPIWGDLPVQDTPYSISVVPADLIQNLQAYQPEDIVKVIPQITKTNGSQNAVGGGNPFFYIRGFSVSEFTNGAGVTYDGMLAAGGFFDEVLEDKERVEVLSGVDGFLYGTGSVGGNINYVLKRPTATPYASVTAGDNAGENGYIHGDFGGPLNIPGLGDGLFGYRLNIAAQEGHTSIYDSSVDRNLVSSAIDIHLMDGLLVQFNAAHSFYKIYGGSPGFSTTFTTNSSLGFPYPAPANPATIGNPSWSTFSDETDNGGVKITWKPNDIFTLRSAYDYTREVRANQASFSSRIENYSGLMLQTSSGPGEGIYYYTNSGYTFLDVNFSTLGIQHKLTTGFTGFVRIQNANPYSASYSPSYSGTNNFYNETSIYNSITPGFTYSYTGLFYDYTQQFAENYVIGDEIKFNEQFSILAGANYSTLGAEWWIPGDASLDYDKAALTPTVSVIYKVLPWFTTYATYQQSLQSGAAVLNGNGIIYTNNGTILPPYLGNQYEVGAKATIGKNLLVTAALFDIDKANIYTINNPNGTETELEDGREVHKGLELTATGKIYDDLTLIGGFTAMNPRITSDTANPKENGNLAQNVSPFSGKLYVEYNFPYMEQFSFLRGLTLIGGFQASSWYYGDLPNATKFPGYVVGDLGLRYMTKIADKPLTLRFNVNNVANTAYWLVEGREGTPRTFLATAEMKF